MKLLKDCHTPSSLLFNKKKSGILTTRNRNQPVDEDDWLTDDEDSEVPKFKKELHYAEVKHKKANKAHNSRSQATVVDEERQPVRTKESTSVPLKEFIELDGIVIKARVKYLRICIEATVPDTLRSVTHQLTKYLSYMKSK